MRALRACIRIRKVGGGVIKLSPYQTLPNVLVFVIMCAVIKLSVGRLLRMKSHQKVVGLTLYRVLLAHYTPNNYATHIYHSRNCDSPRRNRGRGLFLLFRWRGERRRCAEWNHELTDSRTNDDVKHWDNSNYHHKLIKHTDDSFCAAGTDK